MAERIQNSTVDPDIGMRRSGGSNGDPHGGHEHLESEWRNPEANPVKEMVPAGAGGLPPTENGVADTSIGARLQTPNLPPADQPEEARKSLDQPILRNDNKMRMNSETGLPEKQ